MGKVGVSNKNSSSASPPDFHHLTMEPPLDTLSVAPPDDLEFPDYQSIFQTQPLHIGIPHVTGVSRDATLFSGNTQWNNSSPQSAKHDSRPHTSSRSTDPRDSLSMLPMSLPKQNPSENLLDSSVTSHVFAENELELLYPPHFFPPPMLSSTQANSITASNTDIHSNNSTVDNLMMMMLLMNQQPLDTTSALSQFLSANSSMPDMPLDDPIFHNNAVNGFQQDAASCQSVSSLSNSFNSSSDPFGMFIESETEAKLLGRETPSMFDDPLSHRRRATIAGDFNLCEETEYAWSSPPSIVFDSGDLMCGPMMPGETTPKQPRKQPAPRHRKAAHKPRPKKAGVGQPNEVLKRKGRGMQRSKSYSMQIFDASLPVQPASGIPPINAEPNETSRIPELPPSFFYSPQMYREYKTQKRMTQSVVTVPSPIDP